jgi:hypothetical protein
MSKENRCNMHDQRLNKLENNEVRITERLDNLATKMNRFANATMGLTITVVGGLIVTVVGGIALAIILYVLNLGGG